MRVARLWYPLLLALILGAGVAGRSPAYAQQAEPDAKTILESLVDYCDALAACVVEYDVTSDEPDMVGLQEGGVHVRLAYRAPREFRADFTCERGHGTVGIADDTFYAYSSAGNRYMRTPVSDVEDWWLALESEMEEASFGDPLVVLALVTSRDRRSEFAEVPMGMDSSVTTDATGDTPCYAVRFADGDADAFELRIEADDSPVLRSMRISGRAAEYGVAGDENGRVCLLNIQTAAWAGPADRDPNLIAPFEPPPGAVEVPMLSATSGAAAALLGQPAPGFALNLTGGGRIKLEDLTGGKVVALEFVSATCGFCAEATPRIAAVMDDFAEKGVRYQVIDLGDAEEDIAAFADAAGLDRAIALDDGRAVGDLYGVTRTPTIVLIGLDGTVQVYHQGTPDDLETVLADQLTRLLAGEDLSAGSGLSLGGG